MKRHLKTLQTKENSRRNLIFIITILILLIVSGFFLTFHRHFSPIVSSFSLFIHDIATWIGVPYAIYHSMTRSKWFKQGVEGKQPEKRLLEPIIIDNQNPIYKRRTFIKFLSGSLIAIVFLPFFPKWVKPYFPVYEETTGSITDGNQLTPLPQARPNSSTPIGGGKKGNFRYYTVTEVPELTNKNWTFTLDGLVKQKKQYNWTDTPHA